MKKVPLLLLLSIISVSCSETQKKQTVQQTQQTSTLNAENLTANKSLVNTSESPYVKLQALGIDEVKLNSGFWAERLETCTETMIPEMWSIYSDAERSGALRNFEVAAGVEEGKHKGAPFHDGDFYKMVEAASMAYAVTKDEKFTRMIDQVIPLFTASQREDGYIHTPVMIDLKNHPEKAQEFRERLDFETYNMGHLMTAACAHYKATGKTDLLDLAKNAADYLYNFCQKFPEKLAGNAICPSHYMGVVEMYRTTKDPRYLELSKQLIDIRSMLENGTDHNQDRLPFREQTKAEGHAVRATYLYAGVADVYAETGDKTLKDALDKIWDNMTETKLYITGGAGALYDGVSPNGTSYKPSEIQQVHQAFGREYELPNAGAHNETCANIGSALWNWRMFQTTAEAKYADLMETTLYNSVLSGVNLNGKGYFYTNPLSNTKGLPFNLRWPNVRQDYISKSNCCPPNTIRTIAEIGSYLYSKNTDGLWFNMYSSSDINTKLGEEEIQLTQTTNYPWDGDVNINITEAPSDEKQLNFRVPDWCNNASVYVNGQKVQSNATSSSYLSVSQKWKKGDQIKFVMDMPVQLIEANPMVEETRNQVVVKRGPLVYCLEANDLKKGQNLADIIIPSNIALSPEKMKISNSEVVSLVGTANTTQNNWENNLYKPLNAKSNTTEIRLIPYYAWANREEADMAVWLPLGR
ncbi:glycoside hydrolase family 127 protein [uncultured Arcticibacterium sp.]|uniref:aceric acid hydrolase n=1 Tax=uncultured Arcticibacterium sp. TaxID=2173042 RepID=UPI0030FB2E6A